MQFELLVYLFRISYI